MKSSTAQGVSVSSVSGRRLAHSASQDRECWIDTARKEKIKTRFLTPRRANAPLTISLRGSGSSRRGCVASPSRPAAQLFSQGVRSEEEAGRTHRRSASSACANVDQRGGPSRGEEIRTARCRVKRWMVKNEIKRLSAIEISLLTRAESPARAVVKRNACAAKLVVGTDLRQLRQRHWEGGREEGQTTAECRRRSVDLPPPEEGISSLPVQVAARAHAVDLNQVSKVHRPAQTTSATFLPALLPHHSLCLGDRARRPAQHRLQIILPAPLQTDGPPLRLLLDLRLLRKRGHRTAWERSAWGLGGCDE